MLQAAGHLAAVKTFAADRAAILEAAHKMITDMAASCCKLEQVYFTSCARSCKDPTLIAKYKEQENAVWEQHFGEHKAQFESVLSQAGAAVRAVAFAIAAALPLPSDALHALEDPAHLPTLVVIIITSIYVDFTPEHCCPPPHSLNVLPASSCSLLDI